MITEQWLNEISMTVLEMKLIIVNIKGVECWLIGKNEDIMAPLMLIAVDNPSFVKQKNTVTKGQQYLALHKINNAMNEIKAGKIIDQGIIDYHMIDMNNSEFSNFSGFKTLSKNIVIRRKRDKILLKALLWGPLYTLFGMGENIELERIR